LLKCISYITESCPVNNEPIQALDSLSKVYVSVAHVCFSALSRSKIEEKLHVVNTLSNIIDSITPSSKINDQIIGPTLIETLVSKLWASYYDCYSCIDISERIPLHEFPFSSLCIFLDAIVQIIYIYCMRVFTSLRLYYIFE